MNRLVRRLAVPVLFAVLMLTLHAGVREDVPTARAIELGTSGEISVSLGMTPETLYPDRGVANRTY
jgi:hypothetical protein